MQELKSTKVKVYWERKAKENGGAACISFDGIPFVHIGEKIMWCHQGKDKRKKSKAAAKLRPENVRICP